MKKIFFTLFLAIMATTGLYAQQISVVSSGGTTKLYNTLQEAIEGADPSSVIYLPGGGFNISDNVKITKKLTIIGIGHKSNNNNVDGVTTISGNIWFNDGSSGSAIMGCYITGNVNIGDGSATVNDVLIKYCNLNAIYVRNNTCLNTVVNQNYIRSGSYFENANAIITNNIAHSIHFLNNGKILNNVMTGATKTKVGSNWGTNSFHGVNNSQIMNNVFFQNALHECYNCTTFGNMGANQNIGDDCINLGEVDWNNVFENYNGGATSPTSKFHFKDDYKQYENQVGIYAGTGFKDSGMAPVPYIAAKQIPDQTDASGKLNIKIRVKAGE